MAVATQKAPVNPDVLRWARLSLAIDLDKAAKTASVPTDKYQLWEEGEDQPSIAKLRKLANLYKRPLAVFFMQQVPEDAPIPADFRSATPGMGLELSTASRLAIRKAYWYQRSAKSLLEDLGYQSKPEFQHFSVDVPPDVLANNIRKLEIGEQLQWTDHWHALKEWRHYLESLGLFVFQFPMPPNEIRGFSLVDAESPPVIVINSKDAPRGRIFTLFHEYCHILLNQGGMCHPHEVDTGHSHDFEKYCNRFAGYFLVPTENLDEQIAQHSSTDVLELLYRISRSFKVSTFVALRRIFDQGVIQYPVYQDLYRTLLKQIRTTESSGGTFYKNKYAEKGRRFIGLVVEAETNQTISTSRALDLLDIKLKHYNTITDMLYE